MVVLKDQAETITRKFGNDSLHRWKNFASVIGYSINIGSEIRIELNPDRPDLFSFASLDKASRVYYGILPANNLNFSRTDHVVIFRKSAMNLRPYFAVFEASGPKIDEHLTDLLDYQERIHESIGKGRKKVSIGIHDSGRLKFPVRYEGLDRKKISFTTYDGVTGSAAEILQNHPRGIEFGKLIPSDSLAPIIQDDTGIILSMPPVVNGSSTKVVIDTSKFLVDLTGTDARSVRSAAWILANYFSSIGYIIEVPQMKCESKDMFSDWWRNVNVKLSSSSVKNVLGITVKPAEAAEYLKKMGLLSHTTEYPLEIQVPGYRDDIMGEVDLIEDLAKSMRYSSIPEKTISLPLTGRANPMNDFSDIVRSIFLGAGFQEVMTFVVGAPGIYNEFGIKSGFEILNPKSSDFSFIRAALYPGLLDFLKHNKNRSVPQRIFEIGHVISDGIERTKACLMIIGPKANYASIKSAADAIIQRISGTKGVVRQAPHAAIIEGRGGDLIINDENVGTIGEMHPAHLEVFDMGFPVCFLELDLDMLYNQKTH